MALQDYRVAFQSYQDRLFDPAFSGFELYILSCPQGPYVGQAHYLIADMLAQQSDCAKALPHAEESLTHALPADLRPHVLLLAGRCALQLEKFDQAQTHLRNAVEASAPAALTAAASYWLGEAAGRQQQYEAAAPLYRAALEAAPEGDYAPHAYYALGWLARQRGDTAAALEAFDGFLRLAPSHDLAARVRFARADLLRQAGRVEAAAEAFKRLAQDAAAPLRDEALFRWAEMAYQLQRYAEAQTAYGQLVQLLPQSNRTQESLLGLGWAALRQQRCDAVVEAWEKLLQRAPQMAQSQELHYHLGLCYIDLDQISQARSHLQQVVARSPQDTAPYREAVVRLAALAYRREDYAEAVRYYEQALPHVAEAERPRLHYLLGESRDALGQVEQARVHWRRALEGPMTSPFYATALYRLGRTYLSQREWPQAIAVWRRLWDAFPQFPERPSVALGLAQAYRQTQGCEAALPFYTAIADASAPTIDPQVVRRARVGCLLALKQYADIIDLLAPDGPAALGSAMEPALLYTLGQAYMQQQQFGYAVDVFAELRRNVPEDPLVITILPRYAYALERLGRPGEAVALWQTYLERVGVEAADDRVRLQLHAGRLALRAQQFDAALALLTPVCEAAAPAAAAEACYWLGEARRLQQQPQQAIEMYRDLLHRHDTESHWATLARLRLGTMYEQQQQWEQALAMYRSVRETSTDAQLVATAQQRIEAIEAGRHSGSGSPPPAAVPARSSKG